MYAGVQFHAPDGWGVFRKGQRYYFAGDRRDGTVLVVWFMKSRGAWRVYTLMPLRKDFEAALVSDDHKLKQLAVQHRLPEWLMDVESVDFEAVEETRYEGKTQTYRAQAEKRVLKIAPALDHADEILNAANPLKEIARCARSAGVTEHPHRLQVWYFAYQLHGQDFWALKQPTHMSGRWDRNAEPHRNRKLGRPSLHGGNYGSPSTLTRDQILKSYLSRCALGVTMASIHTTALIEDFGCVPIEVNGVFEYVHPQNKPFPTYGQFRYVVVKEYKLENVQTTLYGAARMRLKAVSEDGNFTEQYANILEGFEVDAYYTERPSSMQSDDPAEPIAVARGICVGTGTVCPASTTLSCQRQLS